MKVWGIPPETVRDAAAAVGVKVYGDWRGDGIRKDGRGIRFRLTVDPTRRLPDGTLPYQRVSRRLYDNQKGRRVSAVCWHGHRDFMRVLFAMNPNARIQTALADYKGAADFEMKFRDTHGEGNGYNLSYGQACACGEDVRSGRHMKILDAGTVQAA